jgi:Fe-S cluster assembly protein SufD
MESKEKYINDFKSFNERQDSYAQLREESIGHFARLGFPTIKNEEWKYTNVSPLTKIDFHHSSPADKSSLTQKDINDFLICDSASTVLVFINGHYHPSLSKIADNKNVTVKSLAASLNDAVVKEHFGKYASVKNESFIALNTAFTFDGAFIHIPANAIVDAPIHLLYISDARKAATVAYPRNLVVAEKGSQAKIVESFHCIQSGNNNLTNSVTEIALKENAILEFNKIQKETNEAFHINHTEAYLSRNSTFNINTVTLGGEIVRNNLHIVLDDENCTTHLYGLYLLNGNQLVDNHTLVDHAMPNCFSNELYKGIIDDKAHGVFNGKIYVRQDAQKTNAYQSNKNILLSNDATMYAKPQLEIYADDVKCSHGATTGQLDEEALFYLRSRGIGEESARALLNTAFASDIINKITIPELKDNLVQYLTNKLHTAEV